MTLIDVKLLRGPNPILDVIATANGRDPGIGHIGAGLYLCSHWNFDMCVNTFDLDQSGLKIEQYPDLGELGAYGVCDSPAQLVEKCPLLTAEGRRFVVSFVLLEKKNEPPRGGWRWHKWGEYIGTQSKQHEYLYDEEEIEKVYTYHVYELLP